MQYRNALIKEWIKHRFAIEGAIAQISQIFQAPNHTDLDNVLKIVGEAVSVNRTHIIRVKPDNHIEYSHEWCDENTPSQRESSTKLTTLVYPIIMEKLKYSENIMIPDIEAFSIESGSEMEVLRSQHIRSMLIIPIHSTAGNLIGAMAFEDTQGSREWLGEEVQALRVVTEMVSISWERIQAKEALEKSEKMYKTLYEESKMAEEVYRSLINSSADAIVISDLERKTKYISPSFSELFGWSLEELEGTTIPFIPSPEIGIHNTLIAKVVELGVSCQGFETKRTTKDGWLMDVSLSLSRYNDHKGRPAGILTVIRDTSERKKLEAQLIQAQKMEAIGTLAGGIAHDFNNILQAILGCTEILLMGKHSDNKEYNKLQTIEKSARKASNLIKRLLIFSRKVEKKTVPVNLNSEIDVVLKILERTIPKMICIELDLDQCLWMIHADPVQLEQVVMNLGVNARDAMPEGGVLRIKTENITLNDDFCTINPGSLAGEYVLLTVQDNGYGMDEDVLKHIYEPFFTTKKKGDGTGLGLAMVYGIIKSHSGYITCTSKINKGTTFKIYFPKIKGKIVPLELFEKRPLLKGNNETILLVDDEKTNRELGEEILSEHGYHVIMASDGEGALERYRKQKDKIDLVILDLIMPGIGGTKCLKNLMELDPQAKVIISSGCSVQDSEKLAIKYGARDYIYKPYDVHQMLDVVKKALV